jgi:polyhydroxybutyrate depolymerase
MPYFAGTTRASLTVDSEERGFLIHLPPDYDGTATLPVVLSFHGYGSNAEQQELYTGLSAAGDERGVILVYPQGLGAPAAWNAFGFFGADDVGFTRALVDLLIDAYCGDPERIYASGMSNGAAMSALLGCEAGDLFAAIAGVAGLTYPAACDAEAAGPMPVLAFHGDQDLVWPVGGGLSTLGVQVPSPREAVESWRAHNGCDSEEEATDVEDIERQEGAGCEASVVYYEVAGGGHTWPGAVDVPALGPTTHAISANDLMLDFFLERSLSR